MTWEMVIGLEVHAQLNTQSKLFSSAPTTFGQAPNSQTSFIDAGLPGTLPVLNREAVRLAIQLGLALNATINDLSYFERKNYFYPDLPKGYQISQYQRPIIADGYLMVGLKKIVITRAHLEEDAGKSLHEAHTFCTGIDLNRAGIPLIEIVTAPCFHTAHEVVDYLKTLQRLLRHLGVCDGNMQEGSLRCDVNLSLRPTGRCDLGTRTELKNLNSFKFIEKAIDYERDRQQAVLERGEAVIQETRLYHPDSNTTQTMRSKEDANDYRYFSDPDLLPIKITAEWLAEIKRTLPLTPAQIAHTLQTQDGLSDDDIEFLLTTPGHVKFYTAIKQERALPAMFIINWLKGHYAALVNEKGWSFGHSAIPAAQAAILLEQLHAQTITMKLAKQILWKMAEGQRDVETLLHAVNYQPLARAELTKIVHDIIQQYPDQVAEYRAGKEKLLAFFVGQVMKQTKGHAAAGDINAVVKENL